MQTQTLVIGLTWLSVLQKVRWLLTPGITGIGWLTGSSPNLILFALWLSFSQACARICSACTEVRWAGVGRVYKNKEYNSNRAADINVMNAERQSVTCSSLESFYVYIYQL